MPWLPSVAVERVGLSDRSIQTVHRDCLPLADARHPTDEAKYDLELSHAGTRERDVAVGLHFRDRAGDRGPCPSAGCSFGRRTR